MIKRKGYALPTAILLCTFLLLVSISVGTILFVNTSNNKITNIKATYDLIYLKTHNEFIANESIDEEDFTNKTFKWEIYEKEDNNRIKALAAYSKADELMFYSIYDFEHGDVLAYQTKSFYITTFGENKYLGGIVKVVR